jgi:hypothetical protein
MQICFRCQIDLHGFYITGIAIIFELSHQDLESKFLLILHHLTNLIGIDDENVLIDFAESPKAIVLVGI